MWGRLLCSLVALASSAISAPTAPQWKFTLQNSTSGIVALESIVVSPTLVLFFDRATDDPLQINNHSAWGALWDLETSTVRPLDVFSNSFCASGAMLSNGSMVSVGGDPRGFDGNPAIGPNGNVGIRIFEPCTSPDGDGCTLFDDPATLHLAVRRWYPSSVRIFDGSLMIIGGMHVNGFYNLDPENSIEFFPPKDAGVTRPSPFLARTVPANMFPRAFALPDGRVFVVANNQSMIYDIETGTETPGPDIPNNVRVSNPVDGSGILLPLSPPDYVPEVLICGGTDMDPSTPEEDLSIEQPASDQCSRITVTDEGIAKGWVVEHMLEGREMPEMLHLPNGQVLITNGAQTGFSGYAAVGDAMDNGNADHPALTPSLYTPDAPLGQRISNSEMPTTDIPRMYHSSATLTPQGNFLLAGSNPNTQTTPPGPGIKFPSEFRVETLDPPFMFVERPALGELPAKLKFGQNVTVPVTVPSTLKASSVKVSLMDLGFSTHAFHSSARLVFMDATLSQDGKSLTFTTPPNPRVYPPGPAYVFLTVNEVSSPGVQVMMGSGGSPPVSE